MTRRLVLSTLLGAGSACAAVGLFATSAWLIARASQQPGASALFTAIAGVQFFALARALLRYGERLTGHDAALRSLTALRVAVYRRLEPLAPAGLPAFREGDLLARLVRDVDARQDFLLRVVPPFAVAILAGGATVVLLWWLLPAAGLVVLVALGLSSTAVPWLTGRLARRAEAGQARARGELTAATVELLEGAPELLVNGALEPRLAGIAALDAQLARKAAAGARTAGTGLGLVTLLVGLALFGVVVIGAGRLDTVTLAVVALVSLATLELVAGLPVAAQMLTHVRESAARVREVFEAPLPVREPARPAPLPASRTLRVRDLRAPYGLHGVDLDLAPGRKVAVVGPSGAGKSTLANVLLRFLDYEGSATLGGTELRDLDGDAVRTVVGLVAQDAHVFDTTLHENVRLARREASEAELRDALARVRLLDWIDSQPNGLETEAGRRLSGGERRRIALARAELAAFELLILDEPGEHLDAGTADAILADSLDSDRGMIVITHRLAGLESMDEIVVLDAGRVVERGSHAELLRSGGRYAESWTRARNTR